ncbi:MAG: hypothetical protein QNK04_30415 [Myxococcota bacterium]|nr:hypothetical protein [Myxococcota bacterium]
MGRSDRKPPGGNAEGTDRGTGTALAARVTEGLGALFAGADKGADRLRGAARELRRTPAFSHAIAARERGNLEAAFWLLAEAFAERPEDPETAVAYWDAAVQLRRVDVASPAGVKLVQQHAAAGEVDLAAQYWSELVDVAPDVLVAPTALATILPALRKRIETAKDDDRKEELRGLMRRAMRHAVDPRNEELGPGVALRLFEDGRHVNPEAARLAAEVALQSPHLHEAKRARLETWLKGGDPDAQPEPAEPAGPSSPPKRQRPPPRPGRAAEAARPERPKPRSKVRSLSDDEIAAAAARLPKQKTPASDADDGAPPSQLVQDEDLFATPDEVDVLESDDQPDAPETDDEKEEARVATAGDEDEEGLFATADDEDEEDLFATADDDEESLASDDDEEPLASAGDEDEEDVLAAMDEGDEEPPASADAEDDEDMFAALDDEDAEPEEARAAGVASGGATEAFDEVEEALDGLLGDGGEPSAAEPTEEAEDTAADPAEDAVELETGAGVVVVDATPSELAEQGLAVSLDDGRRSRVAFSDVEAVSVGQVAGLANEPVVVIDLVLNWNRMLDEPLRVVRLRADRFDPSSLVPGTTGGGGALSDFLGELLEKTRGVPLPDPESALGLRLDPFESLAEYQRRVLQVD